MRPHPRVVDPCHQGHITCNWGPRDEAFETRDEHYAPKIAILDTKEGTVVFQREAEIFHCLEF